MNTAALVLAAGRGERAGGSVPKQFAALADGVPVLRVVRRFLDHPRIDSVCVVVAAEQRDQAKRALAGVESGALLPLVTGGATRQASARAGLEALQAQFPARVLIHDAARPNLCDSTIDAVLDALDSAPGAIPALPPADSIWDTGPDGDCTHPLPRERLRAAQTPQGFHYPAILAAHQAQAGAALDDDAALARLAGMQVRTVAGDPRNRKLTTADDLARARASSVRFGQGIDVHAFGPGDRVRLCGVDIPCGQALVGHSDADVALHALADAIYGALGEGDIGLHFPPEDARWKGQDSSHFVRHAAARATANGYRIAHADLTLVCQQPRLAPYRPQMRNAAAAALGIDADQLSVKATTSEGLGFTGRGEGIAAFAVVTLVPAT